MGVTGLEWVAEMHSCKKVENPSGLFFLAETFWSFV